MTSDINHFQLYHQTALVTGGGSGIGLAIANALIQAGAKVCITGRREAVLNQAAQEIGATALVGDVTDLSSLPDLIEQAEQAVGPLSILVNNAGTHHKAPAVDTDDDAFDRLLTTHVRGAFALAREAARGMIERSHGSVVFIGSMATLMGVPQVCAYTAAKGAVQALCPALAAEWSSAGVRVNIVTPGWIETDMSRNAFAKDPTRKQRVLDRTPMASLGQPEDVGNAVVYLCSPAAAFVTGTNLIIDGGAHKGF